VFNLAFVWVSLPQLKAGEPARIWMYYGNTKAVDGGEPRSTYDPEQVLVYHFGERGTPARDATGYANNAVSAAAVDESALIGTGARFDGNTGLSLPASPSLVSAAGAERTLSFWIKPAAGGQTAVLYSQRDAGGELLIGLNQGAPYVSVAGRQSASVPPLDPKNWHQLAVVANAQQTALFIDGHPGPLLPLPLPLPPLAAPAVLGNAVAAGAGGYAGELDELEIAKVARKPAYLELAALNQGPGDKLVNFGVDEAQASWSSGYVGIILHSVTIDGWVIIGLLMIMAAISWGVMVMKAGQIGRVSKANEAFLGLFRAVRGDFGALGPLIAGTAAAAGVELSERQRQRARTSPLFQIFSAGVEELRQRIGDEGGGRRKGSHLSAQSIEAIRAQLDASLVRENQGLNARMVLLTIAIAGGPFLGLLGTVVGVMITFASIAAAGDVNVNAIAPGISAALVATVAGLIVAIPSLFGYNYLITRIKDASAEMQVFLDAFITRMAENYNQPSALHEISDEE
jgi:biopolymer transport protein ExbB